jgi:hypothetical protein
MIRDTVLVLRAVSVTLFNVLDDEEIRKRIKLPPSAKMGQPEHIDCRAVLGRIINSTLNCLTNVFSFRSSTFASRQRGCSQ